MNFKSKRVIKAIEKWIIALHSGAYEQAQGALNNKDGFCCLGVACNVFIPAESLVLSSEGFIWGKHPIAQPSTPKWLNRIDTDFTVKTGVLLSNLNDFGLKLWDDGLYVTKPSDLQVFPQFTFPEIADLLQLVYIEGMLDV